MLQSDELVTDNASEGWTQETTWDRSLTHTTNEEINVINIVIDQLESVHNLLWDEILQVVKLMDSLETTQLSKLIVSWQTMVSASLDIQGNQVKTKAGILGLEEMVGQLLREDVVKLLSGLSGQTNQEPVQVSRGIDQLRVKESIPQWNS